MNKQSNALLIMKNVRQFFYHGLVNVVQLQRCYSYKEDQGLCEM